MNESSAKGLYSSLFGKKQVGLFGSIFGRSGEGLYKDLYSHNGASIPPPVNSRHTRLGDGPDPLTQPGAQDPQAITTLLARNWTLSFIALCLLFWGTRHVLFRKKKKKD